MLDIVEIYLLSEGMDTAKDSGVKGVDIDAVDSILTSHGMATVENIMLREIIKENLNIDDKTLEELLENRAEEEEELLQADLNGEYEYDINKFFK